jgi:hypothetical protein
VSFFFNKTWKQWCVLHLDVYGTICIHTFMYLSNVCVYVCMHSYAYIKGYQCATLRVEILCLYLFIRTVVYMRKYVCNTMYAYIVFMYVWETQRKRVPFICLNGTHERRITCVLTLYVYAYIYIHVYVYAYIYIYVCMYVCVTSKRLRIKIMFSRVPAWIRVRCFILYAQKKNAKGAFKGRHAISPPTYKT